MISQEIPKEQKAILIKALNCLKDQIESGEGEETEENFTLLFDILTLKALLTCKTSVVLTDEEMDEFTLRNGIDFPMYDIKPEEVKDTKKLEATIYELAEKISDLNNEIEFLEINKD